MALATKFDISCASVTAISENEYIGDSVTLINANFASLDLAICNLEVSAARWNQAFTTVATNSANWENMVTIVNALSAGWEDLYTTVNTFSADTWTSIMSVIYPDTVLHSTAVASVITTVKSWLDTNFPAANYERKHDPGDDPGDGSKMIAGQKINVFVARHHVDSTNYNTYSFDSTTKTEVHCPVPFGSFSPRSHFDFAGDSNPGGGIKSYDDQWNADRTAKWPHGEYGDSPPGYGDDSGSGSGSQTPYGYILKDKRDPFFRNRGPDRSDDVEPLLPDETFSDDDYEYKDGKMGIRARKQEYMGVAYIDCQYYRNAQVAADAYNPGKGNGNDCKFAVVPCLPYQQFWFYADGESQTTAMETYNSPDGTQGCWDYCEYGDTSVVVGFRVEDRHLVNSNDELTPPNSFFGLEYEVQVVSGSNAWVFIRYTNNMTGAGAAGYDGG